MNSRGLDSDAWTRDLGGLSCWRLCCERKVHQHLLLLGQLPNWNLVSFLPSKEPSVRNSRTFSAADSNWSLGWCTFILISLWGAIATADPSFFIYFSPIVLHTLFLFADVGCSLCFCSPLELLSIRPPVVPLHILSRIPLTQGRRENWKTRARWWRTFSIRWFFCAFRYICALHELAVKKKLQELL